MFGICTFNLVAIRAEASDRSEMVTQLLFGDVYKVLEESENEKWLKICILDDEYIGWMDKKLFSSFSDEDLAKWDVSSLFFTSDTIGFVRDEKLNFPIFFGSYLPFYDGSYVYLNKHRLSFHGEAKQLKENMEQTILHTAHSFLHTPYLWGGKSHAGIDCSGLVQMVFRSNGHKLKRDAYQQASMGTPVEHIEKAKSCDLAFFSNDTGRVTHVGILVDPTAIIHAHGKVRIDKLDAIGIINGDTGLYSHKLSGIRRIIDE